MIITWRVKDIPEKIPSLFVECMMTVSNTIHIPSVFNKAKSNLPILREYYKRLTGIASIQDLVSEQVETVIPCFFTQRFGCDSIITETFVLCPLTKTQANCLDSLNNRWLFLLQLEPRGKSLYLDVVISILFEMIRIYAHPFLAGCSEPVLLKESKESWKDTFRHASSKQLICDMLIKGFDSVGIYVRSIRLAQYLQRYYNESGFVTIE